MNNSIDMVMNWIIVEPINVMVELSVRFVNFFFEKKLLIEARQ